MKQLIRNLEIGDIGFFKLMFYQSLFVPPGGHPFSRAIIEEPHLSKYYHNWGKAGDLGHIGEVNGQPVGAVWSRFFTKEEAGYGYVSEEIPELGIAFSAKWRNKGVGTAILKHHINRLQGSKISGVSLSVDTRNPAMRLYLRLGFEEVSRNEHSAIMLKKIRS